MMSADDRRHGTVNGYANGGCREECCRSIMREYQRERRASQRARGIRRTTCWCEDCVAARFPLNPAPRKEQTSFMVEPVITRVCRHCGVALDGVAQHKRTCLLSGLQAVL